MSSPLVSVVIPMFNAMPFLEESLGSIMHQDYASLEIIVVDDASADDSNTFVRSCMEKDNRIRLLELGAKAASERRTAVALNKGISAAKGKYIALMDADDWCDPDRVSVQVAYLEQHPQIMACGAQVKVTYEGRLFRKRGEVRLPLQHHELQVYALGQSPFLQNTVMMRKAFLEQSRLRYDESMEHAEDYEFFSRLMRMGKVANIDETLVTYRVHGRQSVNHPLFCGFVEYTVKRNLRELFSVSDAEAEMHWQFVNHRQGYEPGRLNEILQWATRLTVLNKEQQAVDEKILGAFITQITQRRILFHKKYSLRLLASVIANPNWKKLPLQKRLVFALKCLAGKMQ